MKKSKKLICQNSDWDQAKLEEIWQVIRKIAVEKFKLQFYNPHFEIVTFEEMLQIYSSHFPIMYEHWSFGKTYMDNFKKYSKNQLSIAYEVIFNTKPALCYLMENNSSVMQALVMAHAAVGHSAFFANNVFFKEMTNAGTIVSFLRGMRTYVDECENKYGPTAVERILDVCHSLELYAVDRMPQKAKSNKAINKRDLDRANAKDTDFDKKVADLIYINEGDEPISTIKRLREENIVRFLAKFSPVLKQWERDLMLMFCQVQQYFFPQILTKCMNEGFASFWHYQLMNELHDEGFLDAGNIFEFLHSHTNVLCQHDHDSKHYHGINPYKLGYEIFNDIKRICLNPTEEDEYWFPGLIGKDWREEVQFAAYNFRDESFIQQYLSPKVVRDLKLFMVNDNEENEHYLISEIHDDEGFKKIRNTLASSYNFINQIPDIYIEGWDAKKSRTLFVVYKPTNNQTLTDKSLNVFKLIKKVWPYPIIIKIYDSEGKIHEEKIDDFLKD